MKRRIKVTPKQIITASTNSGWWNKYYDRYTVDELVKRYGMREDEIEAGQANKMPGYTEYQHIAWLIAKPEYEDLLADDGYDWVELVASNGYAVPVIVDRYRVYSLEDPKFDTGTVFEAKFYATHADAYPFSQAYILAHDLDQARSSANRLADEWGYDETVKIAVKNSGASPTWFYEQHPETFEDIRFLVQQ